MLYTSKFALKTNERNLIMSSALLEALTYVLCKVSPKVMEHLTSGRGGGGGGGVGGELNYLHAHILLKFRHAHHETKDCN